MKNFLIVIFLTILVSCELGERLDIQDMGDPAGYFLECYCVPGDRFNLTATFLSPVSEPQLLDYSLEFDIYIQGEEKIKMYQSLYVHPDKNFVYNYASPEIVKRPEQGFFELFAVSPTGENIYARTEVPDQVVIEDIRFNENRIDYSFYLSESSLFDYYISNVYFIEEDNNKIRATNYYDYSLSGNSQKVTHSINIPAVEDLKEIQLFLKRMPKENYKYQLAIKELANSNDDNITSPIILPGNLTNALGIFTSYTEDSVHLDISSLCYRFY